MILFKSMLIWLCVPFLWSNFGARFPMNLFFFLNDVWFFLPVWLCVHSLRLGKSWFLRWCMIFFFLTSMFIWIMPVPFCHFAFCKRWFFFFLFGSYVGLFFFLCEMQSCITPQKHSSQPRHMPTITNGSNQRWVFRGQLFGHWGWKWRVFGLWAWKNGLLGQWPCHYIHSFPFLQRATSVGFSGRPKGWLHHAHKPHWISIRAVEDQNSNFDPRWIIHTFTNRTSAFRRWQCGW